MSKISMDFRLCDNVFYVSVPCLIKAKVEHPEIDLLETIKMNVNNLQNAIQGLPLDNGFKVVSQD